MLGYGRLLVMGRPGCWSCTSCRPGGATGSARRSSPTMAARAVTLGLTSLASRSVGGTPRSSSTRAGLRPRLHRDAQPARSVRVDWEHVSEMAEGISPRLPDRVLPRRPARRPPARVRRGEAGAPARPRGRPRAAAQLVRRRSGCGPACSCLNARGLRPTSWWPSTSAASAWPGSPSWSCRRSTRPGPTSTTRSSCPSTTGTGWPARSRPACSGAARRRARLLEVQTWHALEREQLQQVNKELGFRPTGSGTSTRSTPAFLAKRLSR